jgi:precorrin-3B synthase
LRFVSERTRVRTRPDRCPGVLRLYKAPDGHLARIRTPGGRLSPAALRALACAARLGSGTIELTARANVQLRGLPESSSCALRPPLEAAGLLPSPAHDLVRNILASPLPGRHARSLLDTDPLLEALDRALCADRALAQLPARFLIAIDDGAGFVALSSADLLLRAVSKGRFALLIGGHPTARHAPRERTATRAAPPRPAGAGHSEAQALALALAAARAFLALRGGGQTAAWRISDIPDAHLQIAAALDLELIDGVRTTAADATAADIRAGIIRQRDGHFALTIAPTGGRLHADQAQLLAALAEQTGGIWRSAPSRTLTLCDLPAKSASALQLECQAILACTQPLRGGERSCAQEVG